VKKRKAEFLAARYCAKKCLSKLGIEDFTVLNAEERFPIWPTSVCGSLSHCSSLAAAATSNDSAIFGIGLDVEFLIDSKVISDIRKRTIFGSECDLLNIAGFSSDLLFTAIFSIKESFFKAVFPNTKQYFDFDAVMVESLDLNNNSFALRLNKSLSPKLTANTVHRGYLSQFDDYVLSIIVLSKNEQGGLYRSGAEHRW
jgi:4'-phosphopantetheinyl transferase EntD